MTKVIGATFFATAFALAGCGGGASFVGGSPIAGLGSSQVQPGSGSGLISEVRGSVRDGEFKPNQITVGGVDRVVIQATTDNVFSDGTRFFRVMTAEDDTSFSVVGYTLQGDYVGAFQSAASPPPTSGIVDYTGSYRGQIFGPKWDVPGVVTGTSQVAVDFERGTFSGSIEGRNAYATSGFDMAQLNDDVQFSGTVTDGVLDGTHSSTDSAGIVDGAVYSDGLVGTLAMDHADSFTWTGEDSREIGVFSATQQ